MTWSFRIVCDPRDRSCPALALIAGENEDPSRLTVERIFGDHEFEPEHVSVRWLGRRFRLHDTGAVERSRRRPGPRPPRPGDRQARRSWSPPRTWSRPVRQRPWPSTIMPFPRIDRRLLIFTNSKRVWRTNTRGDYWVLDRTSHELRKLGGDAPPASLMHAKFAPDGSRVAYVRSNNLYVEDLRDHRITRLTNSNSPDEINGTFDWVYEEEFGLRDGFRWSPDGQLDRLLATRIPRASASSPSSTTPTRSIPGSTRSSTPRSARQNAACRVGVVHRRGWRDALAGCPRRPAQPLHRVHGMGRQFPTRSSSSNSTGTRTPFASCWPTSAPARSTTILTEHDDAWVDLQDELHWIHDDQEFLWLSERDGWRHIYRVDASGWSSPR